MDSKKNLRRKPPPEIGIDFSKNTEVQSPSISHHKLDDRRLHAPALPSKLPSISSPLNHPFTQYQPKSPINPFQNHPKAPAPSQNILPTSLSNIPTPSLENHNTSFPSIPRRPNRRKVSHNNTYYDNIRDTNFIESRHNYNLETSDLSRGIDHSYHEDITNSFIKDSFSSDSHNEASFSQHDISVNHNKSFINSSYTKDRTGHDKSFFEPSFTEDDELNQRSFINTSFSKVNDSFIDDDDNIDNNTSFENSSFINDSLTSFDSPKPMGPKELPSINLDMSSSSINVQRQRQRYRQRLFQHLSRSPLKTDANESFDNLKNSFNTTDILGSKLTKAKSHSPKHELPYPINDYMIDEDIQLNENDIFAQNIPKLNFVPLNLTAPTENKFKSFHSRSDSLPIHTRVHNSASSSPLQKDLDVATFNGHSPTIKYNPSNLEYPYDDFIDSDDFDDTFEYNASHSKLNSTPTSYMEDETPLPTPIAKFFDYTMLPELPGLNSHAETKKNVLSKSPTRSNPYFPSNSPSSKSKKFEELPPVPLDLPRLSFTSASLSSQHLSICKNVWSKSQVFNWCLKLKTWLHDLFIPKREFKTALIKLFLFHRRDIPLDVIAKNVDQFVLTCIKAGAVEYLPKGGDEFGVMLHDFVPVSGVLTDLTACYGGVHDERDLKLRCYSSYCHLNRIIDHENQLKNTNINSLVLGEDWAAHWKLTVDDLKNIHPDVSKRQSLLFDLLRFEQTFIQRGRLFVEVVGPQFSKAAKALAKPADLSQINKFETDVLKPARELVEIHEKTLFENLLKLLISEGRFINSVLDIGNLYHKWAKDVQPALLKYMSVVPMIELLLSDPILKQWIDEKTSGIERARELKVNGHLLFLSTFNSRYQSLPLQLSDIKKLFDTQEPEYVSLTKAIDSIKHLGTRVNHMKRHADNVHALKQIHRQVVWKHSIKQPNINLGSEQRRFINRGDVGRKSDLRIVSSTNHLILLDNYLLICEKAKDSKTRLDTYKVIEQPIPICLLLVEEKDTYSETINPQVNGLQSVPVLNELHDPEAENSTFPFKVRFAGRGKHDSYTFFMKTDRERSEWIKHFSYARSKASEMAELTEPYSLSSIANRCFAYENSERILKLQVCAPHDPIYDISSDARQQLTKLGVLGDIAQFTNARNHIVFSEVQCMEIFYYQSSKFYLVGLHAGIYCFDQKNRWKKVLNGDDIKKISVQSDIGLVIILTGKQFKYYTLDLILNVYYEKTKHITSVSLSDDLVSYFEVGFHRNIKMVFYSKKRTTTGTTNFELLIPETDNGGIFSTFKIVKMFSIQAECYGISIFNSSFAIHTSKGFEILELDKLIPRSLPDFSSTGKKDPGIEFVKKQLLHLSQKPMGMFKLSNNSEFLLVYNDCAVFLDKRGRISRSSSLLFQFKAKSVAFYNNDLIISCDEAIEVWTISDFTSGSNKLTQVVVGKGITMLNENHLCFAIANPLVPGMQILTQFVPKVLPAYEI